MNESTRGAYSIPSRDGVILNELFAYKEKDHTGLNKYSIPSKVSPKETFNPVSMWLTSQLKLPGCLIPIQIKKLKILNYSRDESRYIKSTETS